MYIDDYEFECIEPLGCDGQCRYCLREYECESCEYLYECPYVGTNLECGYIR